MAEPLELVCPCCGAALDGRVAIAGRDRWQGVEGRFDVTICSRCGAGITLPRLPDEALGGFYPEAYSPYVPVQGKGITARVYDVLQRRALQAPPFDTLVARPAGRLVDVGCGRGDLGARLIERGWQVTGVEPSPQACEVARSRGIDAREGTLATVALEPEGYDAAVFQHSLEHVTDPVTNLERTREGLKPGGIVAIVVPNFASWQRRRFGGRWFHLDLPRHRVHFTPKALETAFERAGLAPVAIGTATSAVGLPGTLQYAVAGRCVFPSGLPLKLATGFAYLVRPIAALLDRRAGGGDFLWGIARRA